MGDKLPWFISLRESGNQVPILDEQPTIKGEEIFYWNVFSFLSGSRRLGGMGVGMIPLSEMISYCDLWLITDSEDRIFLVEIISELDSYYISKSNTEKPNKKVKKSGNSRP